MIAIDTNILVRFLTRDDEAQHLKSVELFRNNHVLILDTVWMESEWVPRYAYDFPAAQIVSAFRGVLGLPEVTTENTSRILSALDWHQAGFDFADALHLAGAKETDAFYTFDQGFIQSAASVTNPSVKAPE
jgi:predicted nucleic-acid-binding protein